MIQGVKKIIKREKYLRAQIKQNTVYGIETELKETNLIPREKKR